MTAADIPDWTGVPDQGYEGYRFLGYTLYDGLTNWDLSSSDKAADIVPALATAWHVDPGDHKKWIFDLREGVKFHDGCAWNADAAVWNFDRVNSKDSKQFNPKQFSMSRGFMDNVDHAQKIDDSHIAIYTKIVDSYLPYEMSTFFQVSPCAVQKANYDYTAYAAAPAGTGPYKFDKVTPHERIELVKNADYWNKDRVPKHDRLVLIPMPEAATRAAALLSGQVDFVEAPSPDTIPQLQSAGMTITKVPYPHNWNYQIRLDRPPFNDLRVRQAANYAINRDDFIELLGGYATPGYGVFIESQPYYGNPMKYEYDPEKAKELLKQAGCSPCKMTIAISTSGSGQMQPLPMNELVKEQLEAVGFQVTLVPIDWNSLIDVFIGGPDKFPQYDGMNFSLAPIDANQGLLKTTMTRYMSPHGSNWGKYSNPEIDKLGEQALATFDEAERNKIIAKMHEIAVKDAFDIFIVHDLNPRALSPKLKGFVQAQSWFQDLTPIQVVQ
ncbi:ABC transporter substrate-binding protein [Faunimonas pinastri]|nr:ABC transporter substrate-binding protein [Faunimonas pinastri]